MIEALIFSGLIMFSMIVGIGLGHVITMRGIGHVQPSYKQIAKATGGNEYQHVVNETDPWGEPEDDFSLSDEVKEEFQKTGLDPDIIDPNLFMGFTTGDAVGAAVREDK